MSAVVGMAIDHAVMECVEQSITTLLPDQLPQNPGPRLKEITLGHLLSMQAGLERTSGRTGYRDSLHRMLSEDIIPAIQSAL
jgi:CubicO group peptidase (beta-lactamase class C family)